MDEVRCPVAAQNRRAHAEFIAKFNALRQRASQPGASSAVVLEIADFFGKWLSGHIAKIDAQLNNCLTKL